MHPERRRLAIAAAAACLFACAGAPPSARQGLDRVDAVEYQPFAAGTQRLLDALVLRGTPIAAEDRARLDGALRDADQRAAVQTIQEILDRYCLVQVDINPESRVKAAEGPAPKELVQHGWRSFLIKVHNQAGVTAPLQVTSPNAAAPYQESSGSPSPPASVSASDIPHRFLELEVVTKPPLKENLSGLELEYRIVELYSRDAGKREATLAFDVGQGTQDLGFRNEVALLFDCRPAVPVTLEVLDFDGRPTTASFAIRDEQGRVYPSPGRRLAPDFFFQDQIYRHDGETVLLYPGRYEVSFTRGPEYRVSRRTITVPDSAPHRESFVLERWIHVAAEGWRSGDHHVHAAGCAHYESPSEGVTPDDMMRHVLGEDLNVACVLSWGPCWYHQKGFFTGKVHELSTADHVMRYDVEVSGFPSSHAGHLSLLGLREDDYQGVQRIDDWPSWNLPILRWAKAQGAVTGYSHSGFGLEVSDSELPSYEMPRFDGIGANEYIVDVVHDSLDFISAVDTPINWELSIWYHTLNCGFRTRISGETDFPCIDGERVGLGRVYVKTPPGPLAYDAWVEGLRDGRSYVTDGRSHLLDFTVAGLPVGERAKAARTSEVALEQPGKVTVTARVAALLDEKPDAELHGKDLHRKPYWHLERARIGATRRVPVELIVNGKSVAEQEIEADGRIVPVRFEAAIDRSSWVALRILASSHTNPVFVIVEGGPVRASRRSAAWCLQAVDVCWEQKRTAIRAGELEAAAAAYDAARAAYRTISSECEVE